MDKLQLKLSASLYEKLVITLGVIFGVYFTYFTIALNIAPPVLASAICGLVASLSFIKNWNNATNLAVAIYCGSFAGMGSVFDMGELIITSLLVILLMLVSTKICMGFGGKLGLIAYIASIISEIVIVTLTNNDISKLTLLNVITQFNPITNVGVIILILLSSVLGFYTTIFFNYKLKKSTVFSSAFPSFIVVLILYAIKTPHYQLMAITFFSASFAGMLSENILPKRHFPLLIAIHSVTIILFQKNLGGYGGALGTIAFFFSISIYSN